MKTFLILALLCTTAVFAQAQKKPKIQKALLATNPVVDFHDVKMKFNSHKIGGSNVMHGSGDFVVFNSEGQYHEVIDGVPTTGTWSYSTVTSKLTITKGGTGRDWVVSSPDASTLQISDAGEIIKFKKYN